jgi:hypothetical protein
LSLRAFSPLHERPPQRRGIDTERPGDLRPAFPFNDRKKYRTVQTPAFSGELSAIRYERNWDEYGEVRPRLSPRRLSAQNRINAPI